MGVVSSRNVAKIRPLKRSEYEQLIEIGAFGDEHIELIDGELVEMSPRSVSHDYAIQLLNRLLIRGLGDRAMVRPQLAFALTDFSQPEPDIAVVEGEDPLVRPSRALLLIEVAYSSLELDRHTKGPLYAASGIPEYWIVNLLNKVVERYTVPGPDGYQRSELLTRDATIAPLAFPDINLRIADFVPERYVP